MVPIEDFPMIPELPKPCIGDRIECAGEFGTIKYIGLLEGYPDNWFGIEWDNPNRGKHDGIVNGVRYFTASSEKSGSFVRPEKVEIGRSAIKAITSRYGQREDALSSKLIEQQLLSVQQSINAPFLKLVGFEKVADKQSDFNNLQIVNLRLQKVTGAGGPSDLVNMCPNVTELDISKNLFNSWLSVFEICTQLKQLEWLNVSENFLDIPKNYEEFSFPNLKVLIAGSMRLDWTNVLKLCQVFPNIIELRVPLNNITEITTPPHNALSKVTLLDIEGNHICAWSDICKLSVLTAVEQINLENTGIKEIKFEDCNIFRNLKKLVISDNFISEWESVGELHKLPCLDDLRFLKNPILETETYATCIQLIVARLGNLKVFNGATIRSDERRGAEYDYLKKYGLEWLSVREIPDKLSAFLKTHNRYEELLQKYGTPEESELKVQSKLIKVTLSNIQFEHDGKVIEKKLPSTILIQKVNMLAQRLFNLQYRPTLVYVSGAQAKIEIELNDDGKELRFYSIQDGDKIVVK